MNRRDLMKSVTALAAGLVVGGAKPAKAGRTPDELELERWENQRFGAPGSAKRRRGQRDLFLLITAFWEVEDAMNAVLDGVEAGDDETAADWLVDIDACRFYADLFAAMIEGECDCGTTAAAEAERERRRAAGAGPHFGCPVYRGKVAFRGALDALQDVGYGGEGGEKTCFAKDARYQLWAMEMFEGTYRNAAHLYMNEPASAADLDLSLGEYRAWRRKQGLPGGPSEE